MLVTLLGSRWHRVRAHVMIVVLRRRSLSMHIGVLKFVYVEYTMKVKLVSGIHLVSHKDTITEPSLEL